MVTIIKPVAIDIDEDSSIIEINIASAQENLGKIVQEVSEEDRRVILSENGEQKAVIISVEAFAFLERMIEKIEDEMDLAEAEKILAQTKPEDYITFEQVKEDLR